MPTAPTISRRMAFAVASAAPVLSRRMAFARTGGAPTTGSRGDYGIFREVDGMTLFFKSTGGGGYSLSPDEKRHLQEHEAAIGRKAKASENHDALAEHHAAKAGEAQDKGDAKGYEKHKAAMEHHEETAAAAGDAEKSGQGPKSEPSAADKESAYAARKKEYAAHSREAGKHAKAAQAAERVGEHNDAEEGYDRATGEHLEAADKAEAAGDTREHAYHTKRATEYARRSGEAAAAHREAEARKAEGDARRKAAADEQARASAEQTRGAKSRVEDEAPAILGLKAEPSTLAELKKAYFKKTIEHQEDFRANATPEQQERARRIVEAHEILRKRLKAKGVALSRDSDDRNRWGVWRGYYAPRELWDLFVGGSPSAALSRDADASDVLAFDRSPVSGAAVFNAELGPGEVTPPRDGEPADSIGQPILYLEKPIMEVGMVAHTEDGDMTVTPEACELIARCTNEWIADGGKPYVPKGHCDFHENENLGWIKGLRFDGKTLFGRHQLIGADAHKAAARNDTSPLIRWGFKHGGKTYPILIEHNAILPNPRFKGLGEFVALSRDGGGEPEQVPVYSLSFDRAPLTGGRWVTIEGHAVYIRDAAGVVPSRVKAEPGTLKRFTRGNLERAILAHHADKSGDSGEYTADMERQLEEHGGANSAMTFRKKLPTEIKDAVGENPALRRVFTVTDDAGRAHGSDAYSALGDRYIDIAEARAGSPLRQAKAFAHQSGDPEAAMLAHVHDNLPAGGTRSLEPVKAGGLRVGDEFTIGGKAHRVAEDEHGFRVLRSHEYGKGDVPLGEGAVPIDKGSFRRVRGVSRRLAAATGDGIPFSRRLAFARGEDDGWRTINGAHVHIGKDGTIDDGPKGLMGRKVGHGEGKFTHRGGSTHMVDAATLGPKVGTTERGNDVHKDAAGNHYERVPLAEGKYVAVGAREAPRVSGADAKAAREADARDSAWKAEVNKHARGTPEREIAKGLQNGHVNRLTHATDTPEGRAAYEKVSGVKLPEDKVLRRAAIEHHAGRADAAKLNDPDLAGKLNAKIGERVAAKAVRSEVKDALASGDHAKVAAAIGKSPAHFEELKRQLAGGKSAAMSRDDDPGLLGRRMAFARFAGSDVTEGHWRETDSGPHLFEGPDPVTGHLWSGTRGGSAKILTRGGTKTVTVEAKQGGGHRVTESGPGPGQHSHADYSSPEAAASDARSRVAYAEYAAKARGEHVATLEHSPGERPGGRYSVRETAGENGPAAYLIDHKSGDVMRPAGAIVRHYENAADAHAVAARMNAREAGGGAVRTPGSTAREMAAPKRSPAAAGPVDAHAFGDHVNAAAHDLARDGGPAVAGAGDKVLVSAVHQRYQEEHGPIPRAEFDRKLVESTVDAGKTDLVREDMPPAGREREFADAAVHVGGSEYHYVRAPAERPDVSAAATANPTVDTGRQLGMFAKDAQGNPMEIGEKPGQANLFNPSRYDKGPPPKVAPAPKDEPGQMLLPGRAPGNTARDLVAPQAPPIAARTAAIRQAIDSHNGGPVTVHTTAGSHEYGVEKVGGGYRDYSRHPSGAKLTGKVHDTESSARDVAATKAAIAERSAAEAGTHQRTAVANAGGPQASKRMAEAVAPVAPVEAGAGEGENGGMETPKTNAAGSSKVTTYTVRAKQRQRELGMRETEIRDFAKERTVPMSPEQAVEKMKSAVPGIRHEIVRRQGRDGGTAVEHHLHQTLPEPVENSYGTSGGGTMRYKTKHLLHVITGG